MLKENSICLQKSRLNKENIRSQETKASIMRNLAIKDKIDNVDKDQTQIKLKQVSSSKPGSINLDNVLEVRKNYKDQLQSKMETQSVLRIAEMNNQSATFPLKAKEEVKDMFIGDEIQKLKDKGAQIYSFDIKQNKIPELSQNNKQIGSRMRIRRNPVKI